MSLFGLKGSFTVNEKLLFNQFDVYIAVASITWLMNGTKGMAYGLVGCTFIRLILTFFYLRGERKRFRDLQGKAKEMEDKMHNAWLEKQGGSASIPDRWKPEE